MEYCSPFLAKRIPKFDNNTSKERLLSILEEVKRCINEAEFEIDKLATKLSECSAYTDINERRRIIKMEHELTDVESAMETLVVKRFELNNILMIE